MGRVRDGLRSVQPLLDEYIAKLSHLVRLGAVVVFGSRARGDHWEASDIDLLVISSDFHGKDRLERFDLLLEPWSGIPALEPTGVTPEEVLGEGHLLLWDALDQGRVLLDDGIFAKARARLHERIAGGELRATPGGWWARPWREG